MINKKKNILIIASIFTLMVLIIWQATGGDYYTKYEVVKEVEEELDSSDPLVAAGFYENSTITKTVTLNEFRFGLLPTPQGLFDKHIISVVTILIPIWGITILYLWFTRRRKIRI
ncbi:MAG: hypothetical protein ABIJ45_01485 [Candidatus Zixiibacteriota bacterium]